MPQLHLRERVFDAACFLVGRTGKAFGFNEDRQHGCDRFGGNRFGRLTRILKSHPDISGFPGEANELWHPKLEPFESTSLDIPPIEVDPEQFSKVSISNWPSNQEDRIRNIFTGFQVIAGQPNVFFTKSAMLSFMIPKILGVFPNARFIHIYRYGPSVIESYFKKNFGKYSRYVFTEKDYRVYCAKYWNACILEIEKRKKELSLESKGQFLEFNYESLCQNPRELLEALAQFLGVDSDCFRFDITSISNRNEKGAGYTINPKRADLLSVIAPGMKLKGYLPD